LAAPPHRSEDDEELQQDLDMSSLVAKLKMAVSPSRPRIPTKRGVWRVWCSSHRALVWWQGKIGGKVATKEEVEGARDAFKQRYMRIKGGTYKQWAVERSIKEGPRADYGTETHRAGTFSSVHAYTIWSLTESGACRR
jgi:hypothetical protein